MSDSQTNANTTLNPEHPLWLVEVILQVLTLIFPGSDTSSLQKHLEPLCGSSFYIGLVRTDLSFLASGIHGRATVMATTMSTRSIIDNLDRNVVIFWVFADTSAFYSHHRTEPDPNELFSFIVFRRQHSMTTRSEFIICAPRLIS